MAKVHTIMSDCIFRINESDSAKKASAIMKEHNIQHLPVFLDKTLTGMVSSFDLMSVDSDQQVSEIMSKPLQFARENENIQSTIIIMLEKEIHALPILNNQDQLIGIVSSTDILKHYKKIGDLI